MNRTWHRERSALGKRIEDCLTDAENQGELLAIEFSPKAAPRARATTSTKGPFANGAAWIGGPYRRRSGACVPITRPSSRVCGTRKADRCRGDTLRFCVSMIRSS